MFHAMPCLDDGISNIAAHAAELSQMSDVAWVTSHAESEAHLDRPCTKVIEIKSA